MSLKDRILGCQDLKEELVTVEEWSTPEQPCRVLVRGMTARERSEILTKAKSDLADAMAVKVIIACTMDPDTRQRIFEPAHLDELLNKSANSIQQLFLVISRLSGFEAARAAELEKN